MILNPYGLMETTKSPHPTHLANGVQPQLALHTTPTHPLSTTYTPLLDPSTAPFVPRYQEVSRPAPILSQQSVYDLPPNTQPRSPYETSPAGSHHSAYTLPGPSTAYSSTTPFVPPPAHPHYSTQTPLLAGPSTAPFAPRSAVRGSSSVGGSRQSSPSIPPPAFPRREPTSGAASQGEGVEKPFEVHQWSQAGEVKAVKPKPNPETYHDKPEDGARWVAQEHAEVAKKLKDNAGTTVSLKGYYYITSWEMYDTVGANLLRCEEKGCTWKKPFATSDTLKGHLKRHATAKVVRRKGETEQSFRAREKAAEKAKIREPKYLEKIKNFRRLDELVKAAAAECSRLRRGFNIPT